MWDSGVVGPPMMHIGDTVSLLTVHLVFVAETLKSPSNLAVRWIIVLQIKGVRNGKYFEHSLLFTGFR